VNGHAFRVVWNNLAGEDSPTLHRGRIAKRFKALGAVAALILVSTAFATITFLRVQARGYATDANNRRLDFQLSVLKRSQGTNHCYFGHGSFAWSENGRRQAMRIH
jgi:hypothetical protein